MTREEVFVSLHKAHSESWDRQFHYIPLTIRVPLNYYRAIHEWKKAWWEEMERQFPEYIKGGVVTRRADEAHMNRGTLLERGDVYGGRHNT